LHHGLFYCIVLFLECLEVLNLFRGKFALQPIFATFVIVLVSLLSEKDAIFCKWKNFCTFDDYREPLKYALKLLNNYKAKIWITDTTNGFENIEEDSK
jgi:hypothetical protein